MIPVTYPFQEECKRMLGMRELLLSLVEDLIKRISTVRYRGTARVVLTRFFRSVKVN